MQGKKSNKCSHLPRKQKKKERIDVTGGGEKDPEGKRKKIIFATRKKGGNNWLT